MTKGKAGVVTLKCQTRIDGYTQGPWNNTGFECAIPLPGDVAAFTTTDSRLTISANGNATLTCKAKTNVTPR